MLASLHILIYVGIQTCVILVFAISTLALLVFLIDFLATQPLEEVSHLLIVERVRQVL